MPINKYLANYPPALIASVENLLAQQRLGAYLLERYPEAHDYSSDQTLREYAQSLKNSYMKSSPPLSKVIYDPKIHVVNNALGLHTYVARVQGGKLKSKNEIRISELFRRAPLAFLTMIVVHELAHLKEKDHNKAFYRLCLHMLPEYQQLEFDTRLYLIHLETGQSLYS
jgi:predicted metal-dependent hydrolase